MEQLNEQGLTLSDRPSNYEVYNFELQSEDENLAVISTQEFWNLNFINKTNEHHHYHILNRQNYFIKNIDGMWKIWDNHNPNVWEMVDKI